MIVPDASVVLKWIFQEEEKADVALRLRQAHIDGTEEIAVPDLLFYEVANVLATKTPLSIEEASEGLTHIFQMELRVVDLELNHFLSALDLSERYDITVYDASYIALAQALKCDFVTADEKLMKKLQKMPGAVLLGE